jgi:hypothetical protein
MARYLVEGGKIVLVLTRLEARCLERVAAPSFPLKPDPVFDDRKERRAAWRAYQALRSAVLPPIATGKPRRDEPSDDA